MLGVKSLRPPDVVEQASDGVCKRPRIRYRPDGETYSDMVMCCERCWEPIPPYVDAPYGYVSPDSARKLRNSTVEGKGGIEALQKIVCYECYKQDALDMFGVFADFPHRVIE